MTKMFEAVGFVRRSGGEGSLCALWGLGATAVDDQVDSRLLPKPVAISPRLRGWPAREIAAILNARVAGATDEQIKALVERLEAARAGAADTAQVPA